jgi:hypothetical protein
LVWYALYVVEAFLTARFALRLLGANPRAAFVDFVYSISALFLAPFRSIFPSYAAGGNVLEWSTLFAMLAYWFIALGIVKLIHMSKPVTPLEAEEKLEYRERP